MEWWAPSRFKSGSRAPCSGGALERLAQPMLYT